MNDQQQNNNPENENENADAIYFGDSKLETEDEFLKNKKSDHKKEDNTVGVARIDDIESNSGGAGGTDRAGPFERKSYGDTELNKGLEAQAKDEES